MRYWIRAGQKLGALLFFLLALVAMGFTYGTDNLENIAHSARAITFLLCANYFLLALLDPDGQIKD